MANEDRILHPVDGPEWQLWSVQISQIIARAWVDDKFKELFIKNPIAVLRDYELEVPEQMEVVVNENSTTWSLTGTALSVVTKFEIPLPPKPDLDQVLSAWAEGDLGHPPIIAEDGLVSFEGIPETARYSEGRTITEGRRTAVGRTITEGRRTTEGRKTTEGRRTTEGRKTTEGQRITEVQDAPEDGPEPEKDQDTKGPKSTGKDE